MTDGSDLVFIVGSGRSGTTMLRKMLQPDTRIGVSPELRYFSQAYEYAKKPAALRDRAIKAMKKSNDPLYKELAVDFTQIAEKITAESDPKEVFLQLLRATTTRPEAQLFIEKSGINLFYLGVISRLFPKAKIIHVYRDGREFAASAQKVGRSARLEPILVYWTESIRYFNHIKSRISNATLEVSYEEMAANPEAVYERVYRFLQLKPQLSASEVAAGLTPSSSFAEHNAKQGVYVSKNYESYFSTSEQGIMNYYLRDTLKDRGYDIHATSTPGIASRLRYVGSLFSQRANFFFSRRQVPGVMKKVRSGKLW